MYIHCMLSHLRRRQIFDGLHSCFQQMMPSSFFSLLEEYKFFPPSPKSMRQILPYLHPSHVLLEGFFIWWSRFSLVLTNGTGFGSLAGLRYWNRWWTFNHCWPQFEHWSDFLTIRCWLFRQLFPWQKQRVQSKWEDSLKLLLLVSVEKKAYLT